jgi:hypothetical protein
MIKLGEEALSMGGTLFAMRALCRPRFTEDYRHVGGSPDWKPAYWTGDR